MDTLTKSTKGDMSASFNPIDHPTILISPTHRPGDSAWREHIPIAKLLVDLLRPRTFVELGTYAGASYCAFCQTIKELKLDTHCSAVDTWQGDLNTGNYQSRVLDDLRKHHDPLYGSFSRLLQLTFEEALPLFEDGSVDLLHIDGFHAYDAVKHDFESWLPKMSGRGVILFHDTTVIGPDYGVKILWDEIRGNYPHFEFLHGHGLGILAVGQEQPDEFLKLLQAPDDEVEKIRAFFASVGSGITNLSQHHEVEERLDKASQELADIQRSRSWRVAKRLKRVSELVKTVRFDK